MDGVLDAKWLLATWQLQVAIGAGYTAYMIAYTGIRHHHQTIDTTFRTIAFGLVATAVMLSMPNSGKVLVIALAFAATVAVGLVWRTAGMAIWEGLLRGSRHQLGRRHAQRMGETDRRPAALHHTNISADHRWHQTPVQRCRILRNAAARAMRARH